MPFGDNVQAYRALCSREDFDPQRPIPAKPVTVPEAPRPEWWSEYLLEEWKRKNQLDEKRRSVSPGRAADQRYQRDCAHTDALYSFEKVHAKTLHPLWGPSEPHAGNFAKGRKSD